MNLTDDEQNDMNELRLQMLNLDPRSHDRSAEQIAVLERKVLKQQQTILALEAAVRVRDVSINELLGYARGYPHAHDVVERANTALQTTPSNALQPIVEAFCLVKGFMFLAATGTSREVLISASEKMHTAVENALTLLGEGRDTTK